MNHRPEHHFQRHEVDVNTIDFVRRIKSGIGRALRDSPAMLMPGYDPLKAAAAVNHSVDDPVEAAMYTVLATLPSFGTEQLTRRQVERLSAGHIAMNELLVSAAGTTVTRKQFVGTVCRFASDQLLLDGSKIEFLASNINRQLISMWYESALGSMLCAAGVTSTEPSSNYDLNGVDLYVATDVDANRWVAVDVKSSLRAAEQALAEKHMYAAARLQIEGGRCSPSADHEHGSLNRPVLRVMTIQDGHAAFVIPDLGGSPADTAPLAAPDFRNKPYAIQSAQTLQNALAGQVGENLRLYSRVRQKGREDQFVQVSVMGSSAVRGS